MNGCSSGPVVLCEVIELSSWHSMNTLNCGFITACPHAAVDVAAVAC